jgi:hypothetical protein
MNDGNEGATPNHHVPTPDAMSVAQPFAFGSRNSLAVAALVFALLVTLGELTATLLSAQN